MSSIPARGTADPAGSDLDAVAALSEPARRALYTYVAAQDHPVCRDEAAQACGLKRSTAAFHLDRLVTDGLLEVGFARLSGRAGPGAGRTAKLYTRAARQIRVSLPPRQYELACGILAAAVESARSPGADVGEAVAREAQRVGHQLAAAGTTLAEVLDHAGYEPKPAPGGTVHLANCPFHELAACHPGLVCAMNLHLLRGVMAGLAAPGQARLDPGEGRCCVTIEPGGS
jgi:predicted ArsR family transcriptional regulator